MYKVISDFLRNDVASIRLLHHIKSKTAFLPGKSCYHIRKHFSAPQDAVENYDIVISGGGMVGFSAACALGQSKRLSDKKIILLEAAPQRTWSLPDEHSNRVCALNRHSQKLLYSLKAWDTIMSLRAHPVRQMQVWESCSEAHITFDEHHVEDTVVHIVENDVILESIKTNIPSHVEVVYGARVQNYKMPSSGDEKVVINLENGRKLYAHLLVGADGMNSVVRQTMGCRYISWNYDQMGIVATLELSEPTENFVAWQKFLSTGPVALLPLSDSRSSLVWSTTKSRAKDLLRSSDEDFVDSLNRAIWESESKDPLIEQVHDGWQNFIHMLIPGTARSGVKQLPPSIGRVMPTSRAAFPLGMGHSAQYVGHRVVLVGDAAHRVHPLAGQGVNLGFGDVDCLLQVLEEAILLGCDIGDKRQLCKYETTRQKHNVATMASIEALYRLYTTTALPVVILRSLGLSAVDAVESLKRRIMQHASS